MQSPYIECDKCKQGYFVYDKLKLKYVEIIGNVPDSLEGTVMFHCNKCKALRFAQSGQNNQVKNVSYCGHCLKDMPELVKAGEKISWEDFANKAQDI